MKNFTVNKTGRTKYPCKIKYADGRKIPVPSQWDFDVYDINKKGCIIVAFYMGLRFAGVKKSMKHCLKYLQDNHSKGARANYNLQQACESINKLAPGNPAKFYEKISKTENFVSSS